MYVMYYELWYSDVPILVLLILISCMFAKSTLASSDIGLTCHVMLVPLYLLCSILH